MTVRLKDGTELVLTYRGGIHPAVDAAAALYDERMLYGRTDGLARVVPESEVDDE